MESEVKNWEECKKLVTEKCPEICDKKDSHKKPLFRGQANSTWFLEATLDRIQRNVKVREYYRTLLKVNNDISTCSGIKRQFPESVWHERFPEYFVDLMPPPGYELMAYVRHNGFPSPLLDWTRSLYVAAFFAFSDYPTRKIGEEVAIFVYHDYIGSAKVWCGDEKGIIRLGPNIETHKRHFLQQSEYTICVEKLNNDFCYRGYEGIKWGEKDQDLLCKITMPSAERIKVLSELDSMNINAFSLFGTNEALMHTLEMRNFPL